MRATPSRTLAGEVGVTEVHARDHGRWCLHCSNILGEAVRRAEQRRGGDRRRTGRFRRRRVGRPQRPRRAGDRLAQRSRGTRRAATGSPRARSPNSSCSASARGSTARIRHRGLRMSGFGADVEIEWPGPSFPPTSSAVPRTELDDRIRVGRRRRRRARCCSASKPLTCTHDSSGRVTSVTLDDGGEVGCTRADRRRRRPLDAGPRARPRVAPGDRLRRRDPRLPRDPAQQRTVDHLAPRTALPRRRGAARLRLDLPARQRRGEHRRRRAGHREATRRRRAAPADVALHRPAPRRVGLRRRTAGRAVGAAADGRRGVRAWPGRTGC